MSYQSTHHSFCVELAIKYKVEKATLIHHFQHWIKLNRRKKSKKHFRDGRWWTYQTHKELHGFLPYLTEREIKHLVDQLSEEDGVLIKGKYNKSSIDNTTWYAFKDESLFLWEPESSNNVYERQKCPSTDKNGCPTDKFVSPIPDPKPDSISTDIKEGEEAAPIPSPVHKIFNKVKIKLKKYEKLVEEFGEEKIQEMMKRLDRYGEMKPKKFKEYNPQCHGAVIETWLEDEKKKVIGNDVKIDEQEHRKIADKVVHNFSEQASRGEIEIHPTALVFCYGREYERIEFRDIEFRDKLTYRLSKMNLQGVNL